MSGGLVDDYLSQLLGAAAAGTMAGEPAPVAAATPTPPEPRSPEPPSAAEPPPSAELPDSTPAVAPEPAVTVPTPPPANPDEITEDEFEALLDALHGSAPPGAVTPAPAPVATSPAAVGPASDEITEDEFEALLDALHGSAPPGAVTPAPAPVATPPAAAGPASDEITEDEFEALLDSLHGGKPPGAVAQAAGVAVAAARASVSHGEPASASSSPPDAREEGDDWRGQERRASRRSSRWLRLRVHGQDYGVELLKVQEVLLPVGVLPMRDTDPAILGVMNLRGVVVPVLDLGLWLGLEEVEESAQTRYVVLEQNGDCLALKVSAVLDVHAIADGEVEPAENTLAAPGSAMLRGVTRLNSQPVILLDAVGLLG